MFADTASTLTIIGVVAVGIERVIELIWSIICSFKGEGAFELDQEKKKITESIISSVRNLATKADELLTGVSGAAGIRGVTQMVNETKLNLIGAKIAYQKIQDSMLKAETDITKTGVANQVNADKIKELKDYVDLTSQSITILSGFLSTFNDNPVRRIFSIVWGMSLGIFVATLLGLNVFKATLETSVTTGMSGALEIFLTGLVLGLGASPTHEVIEILKQIKLNHQAKTEQIEG